jgi:hypothetical protein
LNHRNALASQELYAELEELSPGSIAARGLSGEAAKALKLSAAKKLE